jgi:mannitol-specific phosphotransferase system IIBC component
MAGWRVHTNGGLLEPAAPLHHGIRSHGPRGPLVSFRSGLFSVGPLSGPFHTPFSGLFLKRTKERKEQKKRKEKKRKEKKRKEKKRKEKKRTKEQKNKRTKEQKNKKNGYHHYAFLTGLVLRFFLTVFTTKGKE